MGQYLEDAPLVDPSNSETFATVDQSICPFCGPEINTRKSSEKSLIVRTRVSVSSYGSWPFQAIDTRVETRTAAMLYAVH